MAVWYSPLTHTKGLHLIHRSPPPRSSQMVRSAAAATNRDSPRFRVGASLPLGLPGDHDGEDSDEQSHREYVVTDGRKTTTAPHLHGPNQETLLYQRFRQSIFQVMSVPPQVGRPMTPLIQGVNPLTPLLPSRPSERASALSAWAATSGPRRLCWRRGRTARPRFGGSCRLPSAGWHGARRWTPSTTSAFCPC